MVASFIPFKERQPNGNMTPDLFVRGNPNFRCLTDTNGYSVMPDANCTIVYPVVGDSLGSLVPTEMIVGETDPTEMKQLVPQRLINGTRDNVWSAV
jgi:hypothetical protein